MPPLRPSSTPRSFSLRLHHHLHQHPSTHSSRLFPSTLRFSSTTTTTTTTTSSPAPIDHHESHYDPPTGNLFNVPPGQKYEKEGWENIWYWGFYGSLGLAAVAYAFKPDSSIQTWALEEARRRLEREGILEDPQG
ncbi:MAG: hypothetical protein M1816_005277 [Peltula sp. TS41687]|nr:MAG: hypothetical protein M1816_005277 [Peltula sp. TS41687]